MINNYTGLLHFSVENEVTTSRLDAQQALPDLLQGKEVQRVNIKLTDDHVGQPLLKITLEWEEKDTSTAWKWARLTRRPYQVHWKCDGPCGKTWPSTEMVDFAMCEHSACKDCLQEAQTDLVSRLKRCPNAECRQRREEEAGEVDGWQVDELIVCKIILIKKESKKIYRRSLTTELYASQTVSEMLASLGWEKPLARLMACCGPLLSTEDLKPVEDAATRLADLLHPDYSSLVFVASFE